MRMLFLPFFLVLMVALPVSVRAGELDRAMDATLILRSADGRERFLGWAFLWRDGTYAVTNAHVVGKAGEALQSIVEQITHISQLVSGIAEGAAEQSTGLNEINTGVTQLDQVTQQNAAMVEEATAAGHMLNTDATKLAELVAHFRVAGVSPAARPAPAAAPAAPARAAAQPAPSAHGSDDWEIEASAALAAVPAAASGNAARDLWQDF